MEIAAETWRIWFRILGSLYDVEVGNWNKWKYMHETNARKHRSIKVHCKINVIISIIISIPILFIGLRILSGNTVTCIAYTYIIHYKIHYLSYNTFILININVCIYIYINFIHKLFLLRWSNNSMRNVYAITNLFHII